MTMTAETSISWVLAELRRGPRTPSQSRITAPGSDRAIVTRKKRKPAAKASSAPTPTLPRKLTKKASRTASPLIVNGTSMTTKSSGPIT